MGGMAESTTALQKLKAAGLVHFTPKNGDRVSITLQGVTAYGTVFSYSGGSTWMVDLDGTGQRVSVPRALMDKES